MVMACSAVLSGCEHVGNGMHDIADGFKSFGTDVTEIFSNQNGEVGPLVDTSALDMSTTQMAQQMSGGSVEVYGLDGAVPGMADGQKLPTDNAGAPYSGDSSVMVYSVDGGPAMSSTPPGMVPPSDVRQGYPSPFVDHGGFLPMGGASALPPQSGLDVLPPGASIAQTGAAQIYFDHNATAITPAGNDVIGHIAQSSSGPIQVEGYASMKAAAQDPVDRHIINLKTAMDRAYNVSRALMKRGVPAEAIKTCAFGDVRPSHEGEAASRRVEIYSGASY